MPILFVYEMLPTNECVEDVAPWWWCFGRSFKRWRPTEGSEWLRMDLGFVAQPLFLLYFLATMPCDQLAVFSCCRLSFVTAKGKVTPGIMHTFSRRKGGHKWEVKKPWTREAWTFSKGEKPWPPLRPSRFSLPALCPLPSALSRPPFFLVAATVSSALLRENWPLTMTMVIHCDVYCPFHTPHVPTRFLEDRTSLCKQASLGITIFLHPECWSFRSGVVTASDSSSCEPSPPFLLLLLFLSLGQKTLRIFHNDFLDWMLGWSQR